MGSVENYHVIELVGEGSFGKVYKGRRKHTGQTVAMKFIMKHGKTEKDIHNLRQEIEILRKLKHENIIQMLDSFESPQEFCVVTEFAQGELFEILEDDKCLPEEQVQAIAKQLVRALHYLHSNRVIHQSASLTTTHHCILQFTYRHQSQQLRRYACIIPIQFQMHKHRFTVPISSAPSASSFFC